MSTHAMQQTMQSEFQNRCVIFFFNIKSLLNITTLFFIALILIENLLQIFQNNKHMK